MKIVLVASEAKPFIKTNDLADQVFYLSKKLAEKGQDISVIIPFYSFTKNELSMTVDYLGSFNMKLGPKKVKATISKIKYQGINYYFVENDSYFARNQIYGEFDDGERFAFFTLASIEVMKRYIDKPDIVQLYDWEVGMLPCVVRENKDKFFSDVKFVFALHNPSLQGIYNPDFIIEYYGLDRHCYDNGGIEMYGQCSTLKAGIGYADKVLALSVTYHDELLTKEGGMNLDYILSMKKGDFAAVYGGVDYKEYSPENDQYIVATYNEDSYYQEKALNKKQLLKEFNLKDTGLPVFAFNAEIVWQKGVDLIYPIVSNFANRGCMFILVGEGDHGHEQGFEQLHREFHNNVGVFIGNDERLNHLVYAGSDFLLLPSMFEPCENGQMIAQKYGTLPIVSDIGALHDTVINCDGKNYEVANGFSFACNNYDDFVNACEKALGVYWNLPNRKKIIRSAMKANNSIEKSAKKYLEVYKEVLK